MNRLDDRCPDTMTAPQRNMSQWTMQWLISVRPLVVAAFAAAALYWGHRILQLQHHKHCRADIIRIVLYNQSMMCTHIASILNLVEMACTHTVKHLTSHILTILNIVAGGALFGAGFGSGGRLFQLPNLFRP